jgi:hypothetical protein
MSQTADNLLESIPPPPVIRKRLAQLMREQDMLRSLLRVSERKERDASGAARPCQEVRHGE